MGLWSTEGLSIHLQERPGQALSTQAVLPAMVLFRSANTWVMVLQGPRTGSSSSREQCEPAGWGLRGSPSLLYPSCCGCACTVKHQSLTQGTGCACQNCCPVSAPHCCDADGPSQPLIVELAHTKHTLALWLLGLQ